MLASEALPDSKPEVTSIIIIIMTVQRTCLLVRFHGPATCMQKVHELSSNGSGQIAFGSGISESDSI